MKPVIRSLVLACAVFAAFAGTSVSPAGAAPAAAAPLIPRSALFGNPSRAGAQLSPDGRHLSWIAPRDGVMNVWVAPVADLGAARPLTASKDRPIRQ